MESLLIVMDADFRSADVWYDFENRKVRVINYEPMPIRRAFYTEKPTWDDFREFLESRSMTRERVNLREILDMLGLLEYDPWLYVQKTRGIVLRDSKWLRFGEEDTETWSNVKQDNYEVDTEKIKSLIKQDGDFTYYYNR